MLRKARRQAPNDIKVVYDAKAKRFTRFQWINNYWFVCNIENVSILGRTNFPVNVQVLQVLTSGVKTCHNTVFRKEKPSRKKLMYLQTVVKRGFILWRQKVRSSFNKMETLMKKRLLVSQQSGFKSEGLLCRDHFGKSHYTKVTSQKTAMVVLLVGMKKEVVAKTSA